MTKSETDKIFNAITSNGCREMDELRFHQAVNEAIAKNEKLIREAREKFWLEQIRKDKKGVTK